MVGVLTSVQICTGRVCGMYADEVEQGHYLLQCADGSLSV